MLSSTRICSASTTFAFRTFYPFGRTFFNALISQPADNERQIPMDGCTNFPIFENFHQLLYFCDTNATTFPPSSLARITHILGNMINDLDIEQQSEESKQLVNNQSLQRLLKTVSESLDTTNVADSITILIALTKIKRKFPTGSTLVYDTGNLILKRLVRQEFEAKPDEIASMSFWLVEAGIFDLSLPRYLREIIPQICDELSFSGLRTMLRALSNLDLREPVLLRSLSTRLTEGVDLFNNEDVVDTFRLDAETNMVNRPCYLKLTNIVSKHIELFTTNEIIELFALTSSLQHISPASASPMISFIQTRMDALTDQHIIQVLMGMMKIGESCYDHAFPFLNTIIARRPVTDLTPDEALRIAYTICHYEAQELKSQLGSAIHHYIANVPKTVPGDHLAMLSEIFVSIENEFENLQPIDISEHLRQVVDAYALFVRVHWKIKKGVLQIQEQLPVSHKVNFEADVVVGPYVAPFVDKSQKLILEIAMPRAPVGITMRKRHFERLGYTVLKLSGKAILHTSVEAAWLEILTRALDQHAICSGRATSADVLSRRASRP